MDELKGKIAIVTGGAAGIGFATAKIFAAEGARAVIVADVMAKDAKENLEYFKGKKACEFLYVDTDVSQYSDIVNLFNTVKKNYGRLDILVNSAGVCRVIPLMESDDSDWLEQININLRGTLHCCKEALKIMIPQKYGKIINLTSISGRIGGIRTSPGYVASKGGVLALTKSLAKEVAPLNINVNGVAPGVIATEMTKGHKFFPNEIPIGRRGTAEEVANVILFLASDRASYLVGNTIDVNGGSHMS